MLELDELDYKILKALQADGRVSYRKLAKELGVSVGTIHNRVTKLIEMGVIKGFTALIDYKRIGYDITALIFLSVDGKHIVEFEREIAKHPNVCSVYDVTGDYDVALVVKFKEMSELDRFIKTLLQHPYVHRTNTSIAFNVVKEDPRLPI